MMWFRRDLRLGDNPALLEAGRRRSGAAAVRARPRALGTGRAVAPRLPRGLAARARRPAPAAADPAVGGARRPGPPRRRWPPRRSAPSGCTSPPTSGPTARAATARSRRRSPTPGIELVRTGSPYAVAPGRVRNGSGDPTRSSRRSPGPGPTHGWRGPVEPPSGGSWLELDEDTTDIPDPALPDGLELPEAGEAAALRRWREFLAAASATTTTRATDPGRDGTSRMSVHLKYGEIHPRTMLADLARLRQRRRRDVPQGAGLAGVLRRRAARQPARPPGTTCGPSSRGWPTTSPGSQLRGLAARPHRLPDRRRRDAPAAATGLDAQPGPDDRGQLPGQGPAPGVAARRPALHALAGRRRPRLQPARLAVDGRLRHRRRAVLPGLQPDRQGRKFDPDGDYVRRWVEELADPDAVPDPHEPDDGGTPTRSATPQPIVDHARSAARRWTGGRDRRMKTPHPSSGQVRADRVLQRSTYGATATCLPTLAVPARARGRAVALLIDGGSGDRRRATAATARGARCPGHDCTDGAGPRPSVRAAPPATAGHRDDGRAARAT